MNEFTWQFGERFRQIRKLISLSQQEFGELLGVSRQTINAYERNRQRPTMDMMEKVCRQQEISPLWLLTGRGNLKAEMIYLSTEETGPTHAVAEDRLYPEQRALISFIIENPNKAKKMTQILLDGGLKSLTP